MAQEKAPAFQFYPKEFLTDGNVAGMSLQERGAYITLICLCWQEQSLPTDTGRLANMVGLPLRYFLRLWPALSKCFHEQDGRLVHPRLEIERQKQADYRQRQSDKGKAGAAARAAGRWPGDSTGSTEPVAQVVPNHSSPISDLRSPISDLRTPDLRTQQQRGTQRDPRPPKNALAGDGRFDRFWASYPNKKGKDDARKAWGKRQPSEALTDLIVAAVEQQKTWLEWTKDGGRFIPHPATWLNRGSWEDEPAAAIGATVSDTTQANLAARQSLLARVGRTA